MNENSWKRLARVATRRQTLVATLDANSGRSSLVLLAGIAVTVWGCGGQGEPDEWVPPLTPGLQQSAPSGALCASKSRCFTQIVANRLRVCGLQSDGTVACWGGVGNALTGIGTDSEELRVPTPQIVEGVENVLSLSAGMWTTCGVLANGDAVCWGAREGDEPWPADNSNYYPVYDPSVDAESPWVLHMQERIAAVDIGAGYICAVSELDRVWCRGLNALGQLGRGSIGASEAEMAAVVELRGVRRISAGAYTACAQVDAVDVPLADGSANVAFGARCWGDNQGGIMGVPEAFSFNSVPSTNEGDNEPNPTPRALAAKAAYDVLEVSNGAGYACASYYAADHDGTLLGCWGKLGESYRSGFGSGGENRLQQPPPVHGVPTALRNFSVGDVAAGAVAADGSVWMWGTGRNGLNGDGASGQRCGSSVKETEQCFTAVEVQGVTDAVQVAIGYEFACALHSTGTVSCWGRNDYGQLGLGYWDSDIHTAEAVPW